MQHAIAGLDHALEFLAMRHVTFVAYTHDDDRPLLRRAVFEQRADRRDADTAGNQDHGRSPGLLDRENAVGTLKYDSGPRSGPQNARRVLAELLDREADAARRGGSRHRERMRLPPQVACHHADVEVLAAGDAHPAKSGS